MKKLITYALIALITVSCSNDQINNEINNQLGTLTFTYKGETKVFEGYNRNDGSVTPDITKPFFNWGYSPNDDRTTLSLNMGLTNNNKQDPNSYIFLIIKSKNSDKIFFSKAGVDIPLSNTKITITYKDENYISGNFQSDLVNGSFDKIKK